MSPDARKEAFPKLVGSIWLSSEWARIFAKVEIVGTYGSYGVYERHGEVPSIDVQVGRQFNRGGIDTGFSLYRYRGTYWRTECMGIDTGKDLYRYRAA